MHIISFPLKDSARFIQGEFDLQEVEHLGMTIKAICTQDKQVVQYQLCSAASRKGRGANLKTAIPFFIVCPPVLLRCISIKNLTMFFPILFLPKQTEI